jgi:Alpha-mannosidase
VRSARATGSTCPSGGSAAPGESRPLAATEHDGLVVSAVKLADDGSGDVVVRLYEALGARAAGRLTLGFAAAPVVVTDLLERPFDTPPPGLTDGVVALVLRPFRILTLRLRRS